MVKLDRIYTRGGDKGMTSLGNGERVPKHDLRVEAYGAVDEANATIGLVRLHTAGGDLDAMLSRIQNDLFDLGADLSTPEDEDNDPRRRPALRVTQVQVDRLEAEIDALNARLSPLTSFILPGGSAAAAYLHLARTVVRRAERLVTALQDAERLNPAALSYINRLSDHLFVAARHANQDGTADVLWVPGLNRG
ncbi:MAG: cob(I)yrinic acid a,c-diamide adenosyltransferase [Ferrovibrio sp.]|uniref:cob(I)yrinic acid a,c-diamide adenosyltransferase n=1 Tax=Ferrovibrio sp. TaxID=1917215 RepID=UPI0026307462|nr:cob(I)yrinic acid a,c-diamide adenosyltransferase [Ferrovibrio sp.]MCW0232532.1 cob(I)yrinic acid a,c-diamide adenosyltransferase [Ferrovibrio sp.]